MAVAPPSSNPEDIAKGGLWSGPFNSIGFDPNTRALLIDVRWTTTNGGSIPATQIPYSFPTQASNYSDVPGGYPAPGLLAGFAELTPEQKTAARFSLDLVSSYTKLTFVERLPALPSTQPFASPGTATAVRRRTPRRTTAARRATRTSAATPT